MLPETSSASTPGEFVELFLGIQPGHRCWEGAAAELAFRALVGEESSMHTSAQSLQTDFFTTCHVPATVLSTGDRQ